jgi:hypothetical protein
VEPDTSTIQACSNFIPAQYCWTTSMSSKASETVALRLLQTAAKSNICKFINSCHGNE